MSSAFVWYLGCGKAMTISFTSPSILMLYSSGNIVRRSLITWSLKVVLRQTKLRMNTPRTKTKPVYTLFCDFQRISGKRVLYFERTAQKFSGWTYFCSKLNIFALLRRKEEKAFIFGAVPALRTLNSFVKRI